MLRYVARRFAQTAFICLLIIFFFNMTMGMMRNSDAAQPNYNLVLHGTTAWSRTRQFISDGLRGEFGTIIEGERRLDIKEILLEAYANSMGLLLVALGGAALVGLVVGIASAVSKRSALVLPLVGLTVLGVSAPSFFTALLLQVGEILYYRNFGRRLVLVAGFGWDFEHMFLPALVLATRPLAYLVRSAHLGLKRVMEEDYIRTAFAKGLTLRRTVNIHALRNLIVPLLTAIGVSIRFSLSSLPIVEIFFSWPGMGQRLLTAINARQTNLVVALAFLLGLTLLVVNLTLDIVYRFVDQRLREAE